MLDMHLDFIVFPTIFQWIFSFSFSTKDKQEISGAEMSFEREGVN